MIIFTKVLFPQLLSKMRRRHRNTICNRFLLRPLYIAYFRSLLLHCLFIGFCLLQLLVYIRSSPLLIKSYCLSDIQICYQPARWSYHSTNQQMKPHLPAGRISQLADLYQLAGFKPPPTYYNILAKWLQYCWDV